MNPSAKQNQHWSGTGKMRGGHKGLWVFITVVRLLGVRAAYLVAILPSLYFSIISPDVAAAMDFHTRAFGRVPWWKRRWLVFKHFYSFGRAIIDRIAILGGSTKHFSFFLDGPHHLKNAAAEGRGVLVLTAHFGNWEAAGQMLSHMDLPITVTGFDKEDPEVRRLFNQASKQKFRLLPLTGQPTDAIALVAALRRGEVVAMLGDRPYGSPSARLPFLGGEASFPIGAYVMASIAGAPLVHVFSLREEGGHYHFFAFPPQHPQLPAHHERDAYLFGCAAKFAADLEFVLKRDPLQWYNFYPFWDEEAARHSASAFASSRRRVVSRRSRERESSALAPRPEPSKI
jgi:predicted LPLAT superfamily acyltransferase